MTRESRLPKKEGGNLFLNIRRECEKAEAQGIKLWKMTIGQPTGPALLSARQAAAKAVMSEAESMHEYQENTSPGIPDFAQRFVQAHMDRSLRRHDIAFLPTPGTKPMLGLIPMACGGINGKQVKMRTNTAPGYPTPAVWAKFTNQREWALPTNPDNQFRFNVEAPDVSTDTDLLMVNYPHNPSGQIATKYWWEKLCVFCQEHNTRLFNDAAYAILAHTSDAYTLSEVAIDYPELSWAEAFSASKAVGNGTGWRIGAICGSPDFVEDIATIKGETDSGFNAALATGVLHAMENDKEGIERCRRMYGRRIEVLIKILSQYGMQLAVRPGAGFFTLWKVPKMAFGQEVKDAEHFNELMIKNTGIVGVHFHPYIRYAVVAPVDSDEFVNALVEGFTKAEVSY